MVLLNTFGGVFRPDLLLNIYTLSWRSEKQNGAFWYKTDIRNKFALKISYIGRDELSSFCLFIGYFWTLCKKNVFAQTYNKKKKAQLYLKSRRTISRRSGTTSRPGARPPWGDFMILGSL